MDTDTYIAMEFLKMRVNAHGGYGPGAKQDEFYSEHFKDLQRLAWADAKRFRSFQEAMSTAPVK